MMNFLKSLTGNTKVEVNLKNHVFYPGNIIEGVVKVENASNIDFSAVRLKICAKERVHIITRRGKRREHNRATNVVYKQLITLAGNMKNLKSSQKHTMPPGTFYYPFSWQLPNNLPPSFSKRVSDDYAEIVYYVKAYVDIPAGRDAKDKEVFSVIAPMPMSQWLHRAPADVSRNHNITLCCCIDKGNVKARIFMDRTLISLDRDHLQIFAEIDNEAGKEPVEGIEFSLKATFLYKARARRERNVRRVGHEYLKSRIEAGCKGLVSGVIALDRNLVPSVTTTHVEIKYHVNIEINIPYASDPCESFPVLIAQSVDATNYVAPMNFVQCAWDMLAAHTQCPEYYYQPPPKPVYQPQMIPMIAPPSNAPMYTAQFTPTPLGLPSPNWQEQFTPMYEGAPIPPQQNQIQWNMGYQQTQVANIQMSAPPPPMTASSYDGGSYGAPTPPAPPIVAQHDDML